VITIETSILTSNNKGMIFYLKEINNWQHLYLVTENVAVISPWDLTGSAIDVADTLWRYTTDVIASCAFGINGHALQDP
jgi:hypothetical protein